MAGEMANHTFVVQLSSIPRSKLSSYLTGLVF